MHFTGFIYFYRLYIFITLGSRLSSFNGDVVVRVLSDFLDCTISDCPSVCLWIPSGQRHEAVESGGYLWQTRLCQTGEFRTTSRTPSQWIQTIYFGKVVVMFQLFVCLLYSLPS